MRKITSRDNQQGILQNCISNWSTGQFQFSPQQTHSIKSPSIRKVSSSKQKLKNEYLEFIRDTSPDNFKVNVPHIELLSEALMEVLSGKCKRLCINMPPRHGKSEQVTIRFPAFFMMHFENKNVMVAGYNQSISRRFSRRTRQIIEDTIGLNEKNQSVEEWQTSNNNYYYCASTSNPRTGIGFNLIILDDLVKNREEANSKTHKERVKDFYREDCYSRLEPDGAIIICNTRWSEDDIIAEALSTEPEQWKIISLPALCDDPENDLLKREEGQALWPERYGPGKLQAIKEVMGDFGFAALYQQRPIPKEGGLFKADRIKIDSAPNIVKKVRAWDLAASQGKGDYTVGVLMGVDEEQNYWILDVYRDRVSTDIRDKKMLQIASLDGPETRIRLAQDPGSAGKSMKDYFIKYLAGYVCNIKPVSGNKEVRAEPFAIQVNEGNVRMVRAAWNNEVLKEIENFPYGAHDDIIDALSDGFEELSKVRIKRFFAV